MKKLMIRSVTGLLFVAILLAGMLGGAYSFYLLFLTVTILALYEFYTLTIGTTERWTTALHLAGGAALFSAFFLLFSAELPFSGMRLFLPYLAYLLYLTVSQLYRRSEQPVARWATYALGQLYIALPLSLLNRLVFQETPEGPLYTPLLLIALFLFIWMNDTGAFLVGSTCGKRKLFERLSPKKSWEGFWGGLGFVLLTAGALAWLLPLYGVGFWIGFGIVVSVFATWGDLSESLLKRAVGVKDSGTLFPGHGGMLDRFDSLLLAAPAAVIYLLCLL